MEDKKKLLSMLAPMEDVTDTVFRRVLCDIGRPDVFFTEFMNVDGYCSEGKDRVNHRILFSEVERPIVFQLWGNKPENFTKTVNDLKSLKPDGFDINMGCPDRSVIHTGGGSALINTPDLAVDIIHAVQDVAGDIPVSVKTRIGFSEIITDDWIPLLLKQDIHMLTVHGRIAKEGYDVPSRWDEVAKVVKLRDVISPDTLIIGNGDILSSKQGIEYSERYGTDGYMVGRGILMNPWLFSGRDDISKEERIDVLVKHAKLFNEVWREKKNFNQMKKYVKAYISGFDGANELRKELMKARSFEELIMLFK